jgi:hypothetical protein
MHSLNFGARTLRRLITAENVGVEIDAYAASDAAAVCDSMRTSADVDLLADQYSALYEELLARPNGEATSSRPSAARSRDWLRTSTRRWPRRGAANAVAGAVARRIRKLLR